MMRRLFIASTVAFWLAIFAFWVVDPRLAAEAQPAAPAPPADPGPGSDPPVGPPPPPAPGG